MAKHHLTHPTTANRTRCDLPIDAPEWPRPLPIAETVHTATCRRCLRAAADDPPARVEAPIDTTPHEPSYGARALTRAARRIVERSRTGEEPAERQWPSAEAAVRSLIRARVEGVSVRSTSDPGRAARVQSSRDPSLGGKEHAIVDAHRTVSLALDRAVLSIDVEHACPSLTAAQALEVYVLVVVGKAETKRTGLRGQVRKGAWVDWIGVNGMADAVDVVRERLGVTTTEGHVKNLRKHFTGTVRDALVLSGEMRAPKDSDEEISMAVRGFELSGWEQIEAYTGIGRDVLRRLVARDFDPIPVKQVEGVRGYHARKSDLDAWIARNERHAASA